MLLSQQLERVGDNHREPIIKETFNQCPVGILGSNLSHAYLRGNRSHADV